MPDGAPPAGIEARVARPEDADAVAETLALAFLEDPVWGWAFAEPEERLAQQRAHWRMLLDSSLADGCTWVTEDRGAAAVWVAPEGQELSPEAEAQLEPFLRGLMGAGAERVLDSMSRFDAAHPDRPPHYYLSLLGTHPDHRGRGQGMGLLAHTLALIDAEAMPAFLESSNPINDVRYERLGFRPIGSFELGEDGPEVTQMWREPR